MNPTPAPKPKGNIYILTQRCSGDNFTQFFFLKIANLSHNHGMKNIVKDSFEVSHQMLPVFGGVKFIYLV